MSTPESARLARVVAFAAVGMALAAVAGFLSGIWLAGSAGAEPPGDGSVDVGFLRDMKEHHAQAVEMSTLIRARTRDPEVTQLALDIELTQQQQIGQMYAWLAGWSLPQTSTAAPMTWMAAEGHGHDLSQVSTGGGPPMPGMASPADLERLARLDGARADRLYLQLMIPHHRGGVEMAGYAAGNGTDPLVVGLAEGIVAAQSAEITTLRQMLQARGGPLR